MPISTLRRSPSHFHRVAQCRGFQSVGLPVMVLAAVFFTMVSCGGSGEDAASTAGAPAQADAIPSNPLRTAYFGELHVHTKHSFDAYVFGVRENPDAAYRFAKGEAISHPSGYEIRLGSGPLDFQAVTDHAFYLGIMPALAEESSSIYDSEIGRAIRGLGPLEAFQRAQVAIAAGEMNEVDDPNIRRSAWADIVAAAQRHNDPGRFTTFIGYEYTSTTDEQGNLHRNVIFRGDSVPDLPFSRLDSQDPEGLWDWLDDQRAQGMDAIAIPHNSNGSNGAMFQLTRFDGTPMTPEYVEQRMRNEPIIELSQVKGTSEVHPLLSPNDEWANFEIMPYRVATEIYSEPKGSYAREALANGLVVEDETGLNPFRFGFLAASDSHNAGGTFEEDDYAGKVGAADGTPQRRGSAPLDQPNADGSRYAENQAIPTFGAAGLAGVWAEENTRESLFNAMKRKETFATSGPRIRVRFFAGFDYDDDLPGQADALQSAYDGGVPMGGDLIATDQRAPSFLLWASRDPDSAPLQRLQIVKVWSEAGEPGEQVFDVACSDGLEVDPETHRCPDNGAAVDLSDCSITEGVGAQALIAQWSDPTFVPEQRSAYYLRVLENPTCRWSTWDAIRAGVEPREGLARTLQERAWSSPIWYVPLRSTSSD